MNKKKPNFFKESYFYKILFKETSPTDIFTTSQFIHFLELIIRKKK